MEKLSAVLRMDCENSGNRVAVCPWEQTEAVTRDSSVDEQ